MRRSHTITLATLLLVSSSGVAQAYMTPDQVFGGQNIPGSTGAKQQSAQPSYAPEPSPSEQTYPPASAQKSPAQQTWTNPQAQSSAPAQNSFWKIPQQQTTQWQTPPEPEPMQWPQEPAPQENVSEPQMTQPIESQPPMPIPTTTPGETFYYEGGHDAPPSVMNEGNVDAMTTVTVEQSSSMASEASIASEQTSSSISSESATIATTTSDSHLSLGTIAMVTVTIAIVLFIIAGYVVSRRSVPPTIG